MQYDPIKRTLGKLFNQTPALRKVFYRLLDLLLLRSWHVRQELKRLELPAKSAILDAGSGFGQYTYRMSRLFPKSQILAVDVKEEQIADCNQFFTQIQQSDRVRFAEADLTKFEQREAFNLILSIDVMEHIEEDVQVFKNFHQSLKPGGVVLISTPSDQGGSDAHEHDHDHEEGGVHGFVDEHVRDGYNIQEIEDKLKSAGFAKVEARYSYGTPGKISWRLSMKYPIQLLGVSKLFFILIPFYYILAFPIAAILNYCDVKGSHTTGTGLIVKAFK
ncbi:bifunctional 2-polyprenyl-6-hydroxyphenol methylase/3-demethylubiquinol 3-O-methyltransferase UbiG [Mangrovibacterium marinum]|uniref:Methyltransferase family protein n=1 Tax=Mangrovibacterium marinum TaxID=1639118 RepID=A0A2T5C2M4_9BACT|nr:class I SAM-dependent methyltransferase [Mangrovibacterium marinum]PTN08947.1 methyltransferase family protein [Mangrovibacterium marinum]